LFKKKKSKGFFREGGAKVQPISDQPIKQTTDGPHFYRLNCGRLAASFSTLSQKKAESFSPSSP
jgi:hypothetical protein